MGRTNEVTRRQLCVRGLNPCLSSSLNFHIQVKEYFHQVGSLTFLWGSRIIHFSIDVNLYQNNQQVCLYLLKYSICISVHQYHEKISFSKNNVCMMFESLSPQFS